MLLRALLMTTLAGLSTGLGGLIVLWRAPGERGVSFALGFAGGVMLSISFADIAPAGLAYYRLCFPPFGAGCAAASLLLAGMAAAALAGGLLPEEYAALLTLACAADEEIPRMLPGPAAADEAARRARALHCGLAVAGALPLHNLLEGVLTLFTGAADPRAGLRVTLAIALHDIPEGISVAAPLWYATRSRAKSAGAAFASGLAEPCGALLAYFLLRGVLGAALLNGMQLFVAGVMSWVSVAELLLGGFSLGQGRAAAAGFALGAACMILGIAALA